MRNETRADRNEKPRAPLHPDRLAGHRAGRSCLVCAAPAPHNARKYCSAACKQAAYRVRKRQQRTSKRHRAGVARRAGRLPGRGVEDTRREALALLEEIHENGNRREAYHALADVARSARARMEDIARRTPSAARSSVFIKFG